MQVIHKYSLGTVTVLEMTYGAEILTVQLQNDVPVMWALVDKVGLPQWRKFVIYGTGQEIKDNISAYIATFQTREGFVWHVFEISRE